jgi:hypothetical protein
MCEEIAFVCRTKGLYPTEEMHREKRWVNQQLSRKATAQENGWPRESVRGMWLLLLMRWYYGCKRTIRERISVKFWWIKNSYKKTQPKPSNFFGRKNPQHAFLRKGSKAVCPMSQICGMLKNPVITWRLGHRQKSAGHFSPDSSTFRY